jgi:hypothetical protein
VADPFSQERPVRMADVRRCSLTGAAPTQPSESP